MSRKKKRNKPYKGTDAVDSTPNVHRYKAVVRSPLGEWWHEHKRPVKVISIAAAAALGIGYIIFELIRLVF